jgi:hypothetical protein
MSLCRDCPLPPKHEDQGSRIHGSYQLGSRIHGSYQLGSRVHGSYQLGSRIHGSYQMDSRICSSYLPALFVAGSTAAICRPIG